MSLNCPICRTAGLEPAYLEADLPVAQCTNCRGVWVTSARYFGYVSLQSPEAASAPEIAAPAPDTPGMKICPECRKFMRYYPVGHGVAFGIDKCSTCGGVWLNDGEWAALKARGFHLKIHAVSSDIWQAAVERDQRAEHEAAAMQRRLGPVDFAELTRIVEWLRQNPHRAEILAHLQRGLEKQHE
jgi:Zn-finger nucleic acid-binding protein